MKAISRKRWDAAVRDVGYLSAVMFLGLRRRPPPGYIEMSTFSVVTVPVVNGIVTLPDGRIVKSAHKFISVPRLVRDPFSA